YALPDGLCTSSGRRNSTSSAVQAYKILGEKPSQDLACGRDSFCTIISRMCCLLTCCSRPWQLTSRSRRTGEFLRFSGHPELPLQDCSPCQNQVHEQPIDIPMISRRRPSV